MTHFRPEQLLRPAVDGPQRIASEIVAALASLDGVRRIALFGSLAEGRADRWSDVDMIVACQDSDVTQWAAAAEIRRAKGVLFYQTFSTAEQPSGRYWFEGESPFHKLDVSLHPLAAYEAVRRGQAPDEYPMTLKEVYSAEPYDGTPSVAVAAAPLSFDAQETRIKQCHVPLMNSLRSRLRGRDLYPNSSAELEEKARELRGRLEGVSPDAVMAGGRIGQLAWRLVEMAEHLLAQ